MEAWRYPAAQLAFVPSRGRPLPLSGPRDRNQASWLVARAVSDLSKQIWGRRGGAAESDSVILYKARGMPRAARLPWFPNWAASHTASRGCGSFSPIWSLPHDRVLWVTGQRSETFKTLKKYCAGMEIDHAQKCNVEWKSKLSKVLTLTSVYGGLQTVGGEPKARMQIEASICFCKYADPICIPPHPPPPPRVLGAPSSTVYSPNPSLIKQLALGHPSGLTVRIQEEGPGKHPA